MKRKIGSILLSLLFVLSFTLTSFAQIDFKINVNEGNIKINGTTDCNKEPVVVQINDGKKKVYFDQGLTDDNGNFKFQTQLESNKDYNGYFLTEGEKQNFILKTEKEEGPIIEEKTNEEKIKEAINELRSYYSKDDEFTFREAIGYRYASKNEKDIDIIKKKYKITQMAEEDMKASDYAGNIIGLIGAKENPRDYKGKNYVKVLADSQDEQGKFILHQGDDSATTVAFSILALDMADADYDVNKATKALRSYQKENGSFGDMDYTAMSIMALGKHREIQGVNDSINDGVEYIKNTLSGKENACTISAVIQGLVAVGIDPLSKEYEKNEKNILDRLLDFKEDNGFGDEKSTEQAFMALADLYKGRSMYNALRIEYVDPIKASKIQIQELASKIIKENTMIDLSAKVFDKNNKEIMTQGILWESSDENIASIDTDGGVIGKKAGKVMITAKVVGNESVQDTIELNIEQMLMKNFEIQKMKEQVFKNGDTAKVIVRVKNISGEMKKATLILALYNKTNGKMINYKAVEEELKAGENRDISESLHIPVDGTYELKAFVWDTLEKQNVLLKDPVSAKVRK
ncbi:MAG: Ig-like domain-containing protein [Anaeromicrobium sp.]|jgi:hypothetical protein|uniref:Ig-like domain-containing protein n=1 Tax=Anaeromicrobium sp. TaxID=1929132 RepID=UPI0025F5C250|nr:Ig-like domain-containing protein [Anaeromicrobium sp.]MCT4594916.1 Ig-like domain-containing protein [Anaeromicrobium sp.]